LKVNELSVPICDRAVRNLTTGDVVFLSGIVHTLRDTGYERALASVMEGRPLPFSLEDGVIWHCGPIVKKTDSGWQVKSAGSTTSSRFTQPAAELIERTGLRAIVGKGSMGKDAVRAMQKRGACYLMTTGGAAAFYSQQIARVEEVYWLDLGMPAAVWVLSVKNLGPLLVGIDVQGRSLFESVRSNAAKNVEAIYDKLGIDKHHEYVWWPRSVPAGGS